MSKYKTLLNNIEMEKKERELYPLTARAKAAQSNKEKDERNISDWIQCNKTYIQGISIQKLKKHLDRNKVTFLCHQKERHAITKLKKQRIKNKLLAKNNINVTDPELKAKVLEKLAKHDCEEKANIKNQLSRIEQIKKKLLTEQKMKIKMKTQQHIKHFVRPQKPQFIVNVDDLLEYEEEQSENGILDDYLVDNLEVIAEPIPSQMTIEEESSIEIFDTIEISEPVTSYPPENVSWKPNLILFHVYDCEKTYKKKISVTNNNKEVLLCTFSKISSPEESTHILRVKYLFNSLRSYVNFYWTTFCSAQSVEPMPIQKIRSGLSFTFSVLFNPDESIPYIHGKIIFIAQRGNSQKRRQFDIPFQCTVLEETIYITPLQITFPSFPIWEQPTSAKRYKTIQIENISSKRFKVVIKKTFGFPPAHGSDTSEYDEEMSISSSQFAETVMTECLDNIWNYFHFDSYYLTVEPREFVKVQIHFKNAVYVGSYQEEYEVDIYEDTAELEFAKSEVLSIYGQVTGQFIQLKKSYIDFQICFFNFAYQHSFKVFNTEAFLVKIACHIPLSMKKYFSVNPQVAYIKPNAFTNIDIIFLPRYDIAQSAYFSSETQILNMPIKILLSKKFKGVPPVMLMLYAILIDTNTLLLLPSSFQNLPSIYLGAVTTHETARFEFEIQNDSLAPQEYGFLNLPEYIIITPNYGFGSIRPCSNKKLSLLFSPTVWDTSQHSSHKLEIFSEIDIKITCITLYKMGELKYKNVETDLTINIDESMDSMDEYLTEYSFEASEFDFKDDDEMNTDFEEQSEENVTNYISNEILVNALIHNNWCEISHQYVEFPETPMGSTTAMNVYLRAINNASVYECLCGYLKKKKYPKFNCHFEIYGGSDEISVEPICGDIKMNDSMKLTLVARPSVNCSALDVQLPEPEVKKKKGKGKSKSAEPKLPGNEEYMAAELEYLKIFAPYDVQTTFTCVITFDTEIEKDPEVLYIETKCRIIRPDFLVYSKTQSIDLGPTQINTRNTVILYLENISRNVITPKVCPLSPVGPFTCSIPKNKKLETEHYLKVPLTFFPVDDHYYKEYLSFKYKNTTATFKISGQGMDAKFQINPAFSIFRLLTKAGKQANCGLQFTNESKAPMIIKIIRLCEAFGNIQPDPTIEDVEVKEGSKSKKSQPKKKTVKNSMEFLPDEEYSIANVFSNYEGPTKFHFEENITVEPLAKFTAKIFFGEIKPAKKKKKGKEKPAADVDPDAFNSETKGLAYAGKFNVILGNTEIIKDFHIIGEYI